MRLANKSGDEQIVIDPKSGEIMAQRVLRRSKGRIEPKSYGAEFAIFFHRGLDRMMRDPEMTGLDYRVWWWLTTKRRLQWDAFGDVSSTQLAAELAVSQPTASRSLTRLCKSGMIERQNRGGAGKAARYKLNAYYVWRGTCGQYHQLRQRIGTAVDGKQARVFVPVPGGPPDEADQGR